jgi:hypothetical protein
MNKAPVWHGLCHRACAGLSDGVRSGRLFPSPLFRAKTMQAKKEA